MQRCGRGCTSERQLRSFFGTLGRRGFVLSRVLHECCVLCALACGVRAALSGLPVLCLVTLRAARAKSVAVRWFALRRLCVTQCAPVCCACFPVGRCMPTVRSYHACDFALMHCVSIYPTPNERRLTQRATDGMHCSVQRTTGICDATSYNVHRTPCNMPSP